MNKLIEEICDSLESLSQSVSTYSSSDNRLVSILYNNQFPAVNSSQLAAMPKILSKTIKENYTTEFSISKEEQKAIIDGLDFVKSNIVPSLFNNYNTWAIPAYIDTLNVIKYNFEFLGSWQVLTDNKAMPIQLAKRLRSIQADLETIAPDKADLERRINLIKDATETAESLPADVASLKEARAKVEKITTESAELFGKIDLYSQQADKKVKSLNQQSEVELQNLKTKNIEAENLVKQCEEAYRTTTSTGLAAAFDERVKNSANAVIVWVLCLIIALGISTYTGAARVATLSTLVNVQSPQWGVIWLNVVLSILSIGAPIWFAWLSTKQINQRFRLSEDYALKHQ